MVKSGDGSTDGVHGSSGNFSHPAAPQPMSPGHPSKEHAALLEQASKSVQDHAGACHPLTVARKIIPRDGGTEVLCLQTFGEGSSPSLKLQNQECA